MSPRRTTTEPEARFAPEPSRGSESEIARTVTTEYPSSPTSTGDPLTMDTLQSAPAAAPFGHHHNGESENVARLLADLLARMRTDPAFRPPTLGPKALIAIAQYQVASAALNPGPASVIVDPIT